MRRRNLLVGCINRRELVSVLIDGISTPVAFVRRQHAGDAGRPASFSSPKGKVAVRLMAALGRTDFDDARTERLNVATLRAPRLTGRTIDLTGKTAVVSG